MKRFFIPIFVLPVILGGCTTTGIGVDEKNLPPPVTLVDIETKPAGALIIQDNNNMIDDNQLVIEEKDIRPSGQNCWEGPKLTAVWPSGSKKTIDTRYCGEKLQWIHVVLQRNLNDPGLDKDMAHAMKIKEIQSRELSSQQQAEAMEEMAEEMRKRNVMDMIYRTQYPQHYPYRPFL